MRKIPLYSFALAKQWWKRYDRVRLSGNASVRVRLGQAVVKTPICGSSLAKQWRERWGTGPPWSGSEEILRIRSALDRQWGKF
ncbi:hypothetical protein Y032_0079g1238 [Ancylostoma ceylanicum]|uniref:Uncharacterized protein n=1 Tax=Ancylostoma ceylanicum TaxID=53326 RepID=A0A016TSW4_9BILA|nr:hypothetical protein Y032_0079g1238 [Ancylostoma ceylanicum]